MKISQLHVFIIPNGCQNSIMVAVLLVSGSILCILNNEHLYSALQKNTALYNETKQYIQGKIQAIYTMTHNEKNQYLGNK